jgi:hypothetical protein
MADNTVIGIDPILLKYATLTPSTKRDVITGIGTGSPHEYPFQQGQPLEPVFRPYSPLGPGQPSKLEPNDGFLRFAWESGQQISAGIAFNDQFSTNETSITFAFQVRFNTAPPKGTGFGPGQGNEGLFYLAWFDPAFPQSDGFSYECISSDGTGLERSNIQPNGEWNRIVVTIQWRGPGEPFQMMLWENDRRVFANTTLIFPYSDLLSIYFELACADGNPDTSGSMDLSNIFVMVGTIQHVEVDRDVQQSYAVGVQKNSNFLKDLATQAQSIETVFSSLADSLRKVKVGIGSLFWGIDPGPELIQKVREVKQNPDVTKLIRAAVSGPTPIVQGDLSLYIGIGTSLSVIVSGGYGLGFLVSAHTQDNSEDLFILTLSVGAESNIGAQGGIDIGFFPGLPKKYLKWGSYAKFEVGEIAVLSAGISGNLPPHLINWDNCGPACSIGVGGGVAPADLTIGVSYTYQMSKLI